MRTLILLIASFALGLPLPSYSGEEGMKWGAKASRALSKKRLHTLKQREIWNYRGGTLYHGHPNEFPELASKEQLKAFLEVHSALALAKEQRKPLPRQIEEAKPYYWVRGIVEESPEAVELQQRFDQLTQDIKALENEHQALQEEGLATAEAEVEDRLRDVTQVLRDEILELTQDTAAALDFLSLSPKEIQEVARTTVRPLDLDEAVEDLITLQRELRTTGIGLGVNQAPGVTQSALKHGFPSPMANIPESVGNHVGH